MSKVVLTAPMRIMVPIIKVVGDFCNLRCRYCFYSVRDQTTPHIMNEELLESFISQYMCLFSGRITFIWHGGEPLLVGIKFFEKIIQLQQKYNKNHDVQNYIQTNGTCITDKWALFFKERHFRVGVSLDGCSKSHNQFRKKYWGEGSFDQVKRGIEILKKYGITPGFIQVLTRSNLRNLEKDFSFFMNFPLSSKGVAWGINPYLDVAEINVRMLGEQVTNKDLKEYLMRYIDLWLHKNKPNLCIREIDHLVAGVLQKSAGSCSFNGTCTGYFCIDYDGKIYPCDRLAGRTEFLFGDLSQQSLIETLNGPSRLSYAQRVNSRHPECTTCEWQKVCHNGCAHHRIGGIEGKYYYCETRKAIFSYLKEKIENFLARHKSDDQKGAYHETKEESFTRRSCDHCGHKEA